MLTVKLIERSGHQDIQECTSVSFDEGGVQVEANGPKSEPMLIAFGCTAKGGAVDEFGVCRYGCGTVYVMNSAGATVAKYDLE